jgi:DNA-binding IclR family transcriptional regulator
MTGASVTSRVIAVLSAFSAEHPALTLSQLSRRADLPLTTTHRLVGELAALGALERDEHGRYRIGIRLWEIASLAPRAGGLREAAMPFLEDLFDATRENVQLAVLDGIDVLYVERLSARNAIPVVSRVGGRLPVHATAVGQVLLAHAPVDLQEQILAGPLIRITDKTITSTRDLRTLLAEVRRTGISVADGQVETHSLSVAAPIYGPADTVVAGLSIVVPANGQGPLFAPAVRSAARGISRALGAPRATIRPSAAVLGSAPAAQ